MSTYTVCFGLPRPSPDPCAHPSAGHVLRVHKLVLLASSAHFERILQASPEGQQPIIILDGTRYADLRALVDYMYRGEVNIEQDQLSSLLKTAETLKVTNKQSARPTLKYTGRALADTHCNTLHILTTLSQ